MCENKTTPNSKRSHTSTTVAPPYCSYSINLSALELKQKIVKQADKWRILPHSTTFCWNPRSWADSQNIKRKWGSKKKWDLQPIYSKLAPCSLCCQSSEFCPRQVCPTVPAAVPLPKPRAQEQGAGRQQSGNRQTAQFVWHASLDHGRVLKQFP